MEPPDVPLANLECAKLMRIELLLQTHKEALIQTVKDTYNLDLQITLVMPVEQTIKVRLQLTDPETGSTLNTMRSLPTSTDALEYLQEYIQEEIAELQEQIALETGRVHCWYCGIHVGHEH